MSEHERAGLIALVREYGDRKFREAAAPPAGDRAAAGRWGEEAAAILAKVSALLAATADGG
mgnify:CR=1 FL=1